MIVPSSKKLMIKMVMRSKKGDGRKMGGNGANQTSTRELGPSSFLVFDIDTRGLLSEVNAPVWMQKENEEKRRIEELIEAQEKKKKKCPTFGKVSQHHRLSELFCN